MRMMHFQKFCSWSVMLVLLVCGKPVAATGLQVNEGTPATRTIRDSRGVYVSIPKKIRRVVTISDGLVEGVMTVLGVQDRLVGVGSSCLTEMNYRFSCPLDKGKTVGYEKGMHTIAFLNPWITRLPQIAVWNAAPNYEKIAGLDPDLMIIRVGSCWHSKDADQVPQSIKLIESLGIPLVILYSPNTHDHPVITTMSEEIRIIGKIFGREARAEKLVSYLEGQVNLVRTRTEKIPEKDRTRILLMGLSSKSRKDGGAGMVLGLGTIDSHLLEDVVHGVNAFQKRGHFKTLGTEQILTLDPDAIILPTCWGYHPPLELYEAPYYANLRDLAAVRNRRVAALPFAPCNCDKRLEYPIDIMVMARTAYPDLFADIDLADWLIDFYGNVYGVDEETARKMRSVQWMDWTLEE